MDKTALEITHSSKTRIETRTLREDVYEAGERKFTAFYINDKLYKLERPYLLDKFGHKTISETLIVVDQELDLHNTFAELFDSVLSEHNNRFLNDIELLNCLQKKFFNANRAFYIYMKGELLFDYHGELVNLPVENEYNPILMERYRGDPIFKQIIAVLEKHPYTVKLNVDEVDEVDDSSDLTAFEGQLKVNYWKVKLPNEINKLIWNKVTQNTDGYSFNYYNIVLCYKLFDDLDIYGINDLLKVLHNFRR